MMGDGTFEHSHATGSSSGDPELDSPALVGIAIPAYRAATTLEATLASCISQTHTNWVAFVTVDGADASEEREIVRRLGDPRITVEWNGGQLGQFANFNRAVLRCYAAGAEWIKTLCADDVLRPDALERMLDATRLSDNCGIVYGYYNGIDGNGRLTSRADATRIPTRAMHGRAFLRRAFSRSLLNVIGGPSSVLIRRDTIERCGLFDDRLNYSGEASLWYRILSRFDIAIVGERPILDYRFQDNSITGRGRTTPARFEQPLDIAREIASHYPPFSGEWLAAHWIMGEIAAANLVTGLALLSRGEAASAGAGMLVTLRRLTPIAAASSIRHFPSKLLNTLLKRPIHMADDLVPGADEE